MSTLKALDLHPALLEVRAVVMLGNTSGLLIEDKSSKQCNIMKYCDFLG